MTKQNRIQHYIVNLIHSGIAGVGEKLPTLRQIADIMGVNMSTALVSYESLISLGIVENRARSGYFALTNDEDILNEALIVLSNTGLQKIGYLEQNEDELLNKTNTEKLRTQFSNKYFNLSDVGIGADFLSIPEIIDNLGQRMRTLPTHSIARNNCRSSSELAHEISNNMLTLGVVLQRNHIAITDNLAQSLIIALRLSASPGTIVGVESPGDPRYYLCARFLNLKYVEIQSDPKDGLSPDDLEAKIDSGLPISCVVFSAHNSTPTGAFMPVERAARLVEICRTNGIVLIENDELGKFTFTHHSRVSLKSLDPENVIHISGMSNVLPEDFAISWVEVGKYSEKLPYVVEISGITAPLAVQESIAKLSISNKLSVYITDIKNRMEHCVSVFRKTLTDIVPDTVGVSQPYGGPCLWIALPVGYSANDFAAAAEKKGVLVAPGSVFSTFPEVKRCFRVNCCPVRDFKRITEASSALGQTINRFLKESAARRQ